MDCNQRKSIESGGNVCSRRTHKKTIPGVCRSRHGLQWQSSCGHTGTETLPRPITTRVILLLLLLFICHEYWEESTKKLSALGCEFSLRSHFFRRKIPIAPQMDYCCYSVIVSIFITAGIDEVNILFYFPFPHQPVTRFNWRFVV